MALQKVSDFKSLTGRGVIGIVDGKQVAIGNQKLCEELSVDVSELTQQANQLRQVGQTAMFVVIDHHIAGIISVADPIKATTPEAIQALHKEALIKS